MANEKNLIPNEHRTPSERRENARKAGIASGKKRRENKVMRELIKAAVYSTDFKEFADNETIKKMFGDDGDKTPMHIGIAKQIQAMMNGDLKALEFVRDMLGEKPVERVEMEIESDPYDELTVDELRALAREYDEQNQDTKSKG